MKVDLAYGKTGLKIELPESVEVRVVEPGYVEGFPDPADVVQRALRDPIASPPLRELVGRSDEVGIVFSDITRPTPNDLLLPLLLGELDHVPDDQITLFNATGTHRPNTEAELREILGDAIVDRYRIVQNDAGDRTSHVAVGTTASGNEIWLHRAFVACDARILTGFIEPHIFAGFSGGGKAVLPGLALLETVMRNHGATHIDSPNVRWGITAGNPLWEEIRDAVRMVEPTFLLNVTLNREKAITGVFAGDWEEAHAEGCAFVKETAMVEVAAPFDVVITSNSGYPLDLNVYQSVKGMSAAAQVVKDGGSIIVVADCWDGIPEHGDYAQLLREVGSVEAMLEMARDPGCERRDKWQVHVQALISLKADVYFYSHNLSDGEIEGALLKPCRKVEGMIAELLRRYGPEATICVLPEGPQTVPYVRAD